MDYPRGIWIDVPLHQMVGVLSLRQALLEVVVQRYDELDRSV